jgi:hypothetical protein
MLHQTIAPREAIPADSVLSSRRSNSVAFGGKGDISDQVTEREF